MKFNVHFFPAKYGDCIIIEYGNAAATSRILIDGGTGGTRNHIKEYLNALPVAERHFELLVVTHIDRDHLEGILSILEQDEIGFTVDELWFNGWNHLPNNPDNEPFGAVQGERLTARILVHGLKPKWNKYFEGKAVVIPANNDLPLIDLPGGMKLTLLSPLIENLVVLKAKWEEEVLKANLHPGFGLAEPVDPAIEPFGDGIPDIETLSNTPFHEDDAAANGSSIAFLAEFGNKTALFTGDAFPGVVLGSLNKLFGQNKVPLDLVKLSHHASAHNTSPDLLKKLNCKKYVISTNGSIFKHPSRDTIARLIKINTGNKPELIFNYTSDHNKVWKSDLLQQQFQYKTTYPADEGIIVTL